MIGTQNYRAAHWQWINLSNDQYGNSTTVSAGILSRIRWMRSFERESVGEYPQGRDALDSIQ